MHIAQIETARLRFRPFTLDYVDVLHHLWIDPDMRRYLWDDKIISRETAEEVVRASLASFAAHRFGMWALRFPTDDTIIGFCGLRFFDEPPQVEILYGIAPAYWGQGLATEAAHAVLRYGFAELQLARIWGGTDGLNVASLRVLEKLGMTYEKTVPMPLGAGPYYSLTREAFQRQGGVR
ncbi:MAG TPA: GNAT family N-acetyltransferase [Methylomirabilota bacterium]|jgi:ribosomal-protein-alanine N-acetyltransferase|nr:GNAT family N-acetyltransferase [Methylomirabilota bacterium]